jgi:hypothetical protein
MKSGSSNSKANRRELGKRDREILKDVVRYRVLTNDLIRFRHLPKSNINATTKVTNRLAVSGWLQRHDYLDGRLYFVPGQALCQSLGLPKNRVRPLGTQTLVTAMALAQYCLRTVPDVQLLSQDEISKDWNWIPQKHRSIAHAVDTSGESATNTSQLRLIRVDLGGTPAHVAQKCQHDMKCRLANDYAKLLSERRLMYVVLTATEAKKQLIMHEIKKRSWPAGMRFEIAIVDELCVLLTL